MQRGLALLAAADVHVGAVPEQRLHHRRLARLHRDVERCVVALECRGGVGKWIVEDDLCTHTLGL